jgi:hypothetical protein
MYICAMNVWLVMLARYYTYVCKPYTEYLDALPCWHLNAETGQRLRVFFSNWASCTQPLFNDDGVYMMV